MQLLRQTGGALLLTGLMLAGPVFAHQTDDWMVRFVELIASCGAL